MSYPLYQPAWVTAWRQQRYLKSGVKVIVPPTLEPITMAEAALHLRLDAIDSPPTYFDEELVKWQISMAREICEQYLERSLAPQTLEYRANAFSVFDDNEPIPLRWGPVNSIIGITYIDQAGNAILLDDGSGSPTNPQFELDTFVEPAELLPPYNVTWPTARDHRGSVRVLYRAGYNLPTDSPTEGTPLPWPIKAAILLILGHLYENRETTTRGEGGSTLVNEIPLGAYALMYPYKTRLGMA
jgi:uncharacterized phiE125 gp8 family phage protein